MATNITFHPGADRACALGAGLARFSLSVRMFMGARTLIKSTHRAWWFLCADRLGERGGACGAALPEGGHDLVHGAQREREGAYFCYCSCSCCCKRACRFACFARAICISRCALGSRRACLLTSLYSLFMSWLGLHPAFDACDAGNALLLLLL